MDVGSMRDRCRMDVGGVGQKVKMRRSENNTKKK